MPANTPTQAKIGYGSRLACEFTPGSGIYTDIAEVTQVPFPNEVSDDVEVTNQDSPGRRMEFIAGMINPGEMSAECNWLPNDPTQDHVTGIMALKASGLTVNWRITSPDADIVAIVPGYVKSSAPSMPTKEGMKMPFTIKIAGEPTFS
jgi:hypothetical protein